jgi:hypothetical protein
MTRDRSFLVLAAALAVLALAACEGSSDVGDDDTSGGNGTDGDTDADTDSDSDGDSDSDSDSDSDTGTSGDGCSEAAKSVYLVDSNNSFYRFYPPDKKFVKLGTLSCKAGGAQPFSMAVARDGTAYVLFANASSTCAGIFAVNTETAECIEKTPFACGFGLFGMGFATDGASTTDETLYIGKTGTGANGQLGSLDTTTWQMTPIGTTGASPEFTGNSLGELWGFFPQAGKIAQIDKSSGAEIVKWPLTLSTSANAWAFAHWGGSYYIFYKTTAQASTFVYQVTNGAMTTYMPKTGTTIVGAGVSTCAPVVPD